MKRRNFKQLKINRLWTILHRLKNEYKYEPYSIEWILKIIKYRMPGEYDILWLERMMMKIKILVEESTKMAQLSQIEDKERYADIYFKIMCILEHLENIDDEITNLINILILEDFYFSIKEQYQKTNIYISDRLVDDILINQLTQT